MLLDAGVVTRCRRRVHLEHDPTMADAPRLGPDPTAEQRKADAAAHRRAVADRLAVMFGDEWSEVPLDAPSNDRLYATSKLVEGRARYIWGGLLPPDAEFGRRGSAELLVRVDGGGYRPVIVVRHKVTDPGAGASTTPLDRPDPGLALVDPCRKVRPHPRDQLRLAHAFRLLQAAGQAAPGRPVGGVIGLDADVVVWHDLAAPSWPGGRSALAEYDTRFADRMAVAAAALAGEPALARPSRVTECRSCPWWPICERQLRGERDVSLVLRGEDAVALRSIGLSTVDELAACDPHDPPPVPLAGMPFADAVMLSRAWLADLTLVRRVREVEVPRADVELDVDMESFGDSGAYLWGCHLWGVDVGLRLGYRPFVTWRPLPTGDEARSFAQFWGFLNTVRARAAARGLTFRAFCYNELAENRWLVASAQRFAGQGARALPEGAGDPPGAAGGRLPRAAAPHPGGASLRSVAGGRARGLAAGRYLRGADHGPAAARRGGAPEHGASPPPLTRFGSSTFSTPASEISPASSTVATSAPASSETNSSGSDATSPTTTAASTWTAASWASRSCSRPSPNRRAATRNANQWATASPIAVPQTTAARFHSRSSAGRATSAARSTVRTGSERRANRRQRLRLQFGPDHEHRALALVRDMARQRRTRLRYPSQGEDGLARGRDRLGLRGRRRRLGHLHGGGRAARLGRKLAKRPHRGAQPRASRRSRTPPSAARSRKV